MYVCSSSCHIFFAKNNFFISAVNKCEPIRSGFWLGFPLFFVTNLLCERREFSETAECDDGARDAPQATVRLTDKSLYRKLFLNPELYAGEAYMDGTLVIENGSIRDLLKVFALNRTGLRSHPVQKVLKSWLKRIRRWHQRNAAAASRKNVQHHYDLSNAFYKLFLDENMQYSCGYWPSEDITLEEAQKLKMAHIAAKLNLKPGMRVLDIGCGWGGLSIYIAQNFDCDVVGVALSDEPLA